MNYVILKKFICQSVVTSHGVKSVKPSWRVVLYFDNGEEVFSFSVIDGEGLNKHNTLFKELEKCYEGRNDERLLKRGNAHSLEDALWIFFEVQNSFFNNAG